MTEACIDVHVHVPQRREILPRMLAALRNAGVASAFVSCVGRGTWPPFPTDEQVAQANEDAFTLCRRQADLMRAYVYLNPNGDWRNELARWRENAHFAGVKLWISLRGERGDGSVCLPLLEQAAEARFPVLVHSFYRHGGPLPGELEPRDVARLAAQVPEATLIMAHMGGLWERGLRDVADCHNIHVDVSGGPASRGAVECAVHWCGVDRVLFGSDMPCRTVQSQLHKVRAATLTPDQKHLILRGNAEKLFGLKPLGTEQSQN